MREVSESGDDSIFAIGISVRVLQQAAYIITNKAVPFVSRALAEQPTNLC